MSEIEQQRAEVGVAQALNLAADLIEPEGRWCQGEMALDATGVDVAPSDPAAVCWCLVGAIRHVAGSRYMSARPFVKEVLGEDTGITIWNDAKHRTQAEVVAALRAAATLASAQS